MTWTVDVRIKVVIDPWQDMTPMTFAWLVLNAEHGMYLCTICKGFRDDLVCARRKTMDYKR